MNDVSVTGNANNGSALQLVDAEQSEVTNCCIQQTGSGRDGVRLVRSSGSAVTDSTVNVTGTDVATPGSNVQTSGLSTDGSCPVPTGNPAPGDGSDESDEPEESPLPRSLTVEGTGTQTNYEITVSDELAADADADDVESWDEISGSTVTGWVTDEGDVDSYRFSGEVSDVTFVEGEATVTVDGEPYGDTGDDAPESHTLAVQGTGTQTNYEVTVSGDLEADADADDVESWDEISGSTVTGWVTDEGDVDTYQFTGEVTDLTFVEGEATVTVDGEPYGDTGTPEPRSLTVEGTGTQTNYEITVSDGLEADPDAGDVESWDEITGSTVTGWVTNEGDVDTYQFTGELADVTFVEGEAIVAVDGSQVDVGAL
jgi:hypothetical protein